VYSIVAIAWLGTLASADDALKARFRREAPKGWEKLRDSEKHLVGVAHMESWSTQNGQKSEHWGINKFTRFETNGDMSSLSTQGLSRTKTTVVAVNLKYTFRLERDSSSDPYILRGLKFAPPSETLEEVHSANSVFPIMECTRVLLGMPLESLITEPGFVLGAVSDVPSPTEPAVRVDFRYSAPKLKIEATDGWMTLNPNNNWALLAAEYNLRKDWRVSIRNEYRPIYDGPIMLAKNQRINRFSEKNIEEIYQSTMDELEDHAPPESSFLLSAFGLPEPSAPASSRPRSNLHYWLISAATFLLVASVGLRWAARR
jgi:hypothetical protein